MSKWLFAIPAAAQDARTALSLNTAMTYMLLLTRKCLRRVIVACQGSFAPSLLFSLRKKKLVECQVYSPGPRCRDRIGGRNKSRAKAVRWRWWRRRRWLPQVLGAPGNERTPTSASHRRRTPTRCEAPYCIGGSLWRSCWSPLKLKPPAAERLTYLRIGSRASRKEREGLRVVSKQARFDLGNVHPP